MENKIDKKPISMTPNQKAFSTNSASALTKYRALVSGNDSFLKWCLIEIYNLVIAPLSGIIGIGLRSIIAKYLLGACGRNPAIERSVVIRNPSDIYLGSSVIIDQGAVLDSRKLSNPNNSISLGDNVFIGSNSMILSKNGSVSLGSGVNVSSFVRIASEGIINIEGSVLIASYCYIGPGNHRFDDIDTPIMEQGMEEGRGVNIGSNTWIGARATIVDGVTIGKNVVIGAHSLVKDDVPDNAIVAGTPAKIIRYRA